MEALKVSINVSVTNNWAIGFKILIFLWHIQYVIINNKNVSMETFKSRLTVHNNENREKDNNKGIVIKFFKCVLRSFGLGE